MFDANTSALQAGKWQRLSPVAILYYIVKFVMTVVKQGIQGLAPLAAIAFTTGENRWLIIGAIAVAATFILIIIAVLSYLKFRYKISQDTVLIQSGIFTKKRLSLSFDRIQNVAIKEPIYFRPFETVILTLESAGSASAEVALAGIPRKLADSIRSLLMDARHKTHTADHEREAIEEKPSSVEEETLHQPIAELARYGLTNNNIWVFAGILAGATAQFDWWEYFTIVDISELTSEYGETSPWLVGLAALASSVSFIILMMVISMIGSIIVYYDYRLSKYADGRFRRTKGLFEKQETSLRENKIQSLTIKQPWPALLLSRFNLVLNQVGFSGIAEDGAQRSTPTFIIPSVKTDFVASISKQLYITFNWVGVPLNGVSKLYTIKTVLYEILPIPIIPSVVLTYHFGMIGLLLLLIPLIAYPVVEQYRRKLGYLSDRNHGVIQSGFIGTRRTIIPFFKVQTVEMVQSPGQRKHKLATLHIKMAGMKLTIPYMPLEDAKQWRHDILFHIESSSKHWM